MGEFFGTDGIRGAFGQHPITPEFAVKVGRAAARFFDQKDKTGIVIGKDTRYSGKLLESALVTGITGMGVDVYLTGVLPTPGIAFITSNRNASAGIVISASHNPYYDNGIKLFDAKGCKLSEDDETAIETIIKNDKPANMNKSNKDAGLVYSADQSPQQYQAFLRKCVSEHLSLSGMKIIIDCSNGATYQVAPGILKSLGAQVMSLNISPNGRNINDACGSEYPETLAEQVKTTAADVGLAFDGDGDRLIAVDEKGNILTGDQLMVVFAADMHEHGGLTNQTIVTTVMSNMGFRVCMENLGINHVTAGVGDRRVMEKMLSVNAVLGGENSGHMIFRKFHTTGDGLLSALLLLNILSDKRKLLSELAAIMSVFPQTLLNVTVKQKPEITSVAAVRKIIRAVEKKLSKKGRVLVRYSGTQPLCRVMVEAPSQQDADKSAQRIATVIEKELG
ncbi:phosphoglucosamine mutase [Thermodesulfobacteriota bacterium]